MSHKCLYIVPQQSFFFNEFFFVYDVLEGRAVPAGHAIFRMYACKHYNLSSSLNMYGRK